MYILHLLFDKLNIPLIMLENRKKCYHIMFRTINIMTMYILNIKRL